MIWSVSRLHETCEMFTFWALGLRIFLERCNVSLSLRILCVLRSSLQDKMFYLEENCYTIAPNNILLITHMICISVFSSTFHDLKTKVETLML